MSSHSYDVTGSLHPSRISDNIIAKVKSLLMLLTCCLMMLPHASAEQLFHFDIQAQAADQALIQFAKNSDQTIIFSYELAKNYQTNTLSGYFSIAHGLAKLLRNTGLEALINENQEIKIRALQSHSPTRKTIKQQSKVSANQASDNAQTISVEKIAIVGSRDIARSIKELPVPIDVLSSNMLKNSGQLDNGRMLQTLAPSFNFASSAISDGTDVLKPATLRGLGPDQTLILVNGKRRHHASLLHINTSVGRGTSGVGINSIPFQSIKRIEILRDGAAAQYGSDAIAGVINIVLKDSDTQGQLTTTLGQYSVGDGQSIDISANKGFSLFETGFFNASLSLQDKQATDRAGQHGSCQFDGCLKQADGSFITDNQREVSANRDTFDIGDPAYRQYAFAYNSELPLFNGELYSFASYSIRENDAAAFFRDHNNQQANPRLQDNEPVIPGGYLPYIHSDITDRAFAIGYRSELDHRTSVDLSYVFGDNQIAYTTKHSINASFAQQLMQQGQLSAQEIRKQTPRSAKAYDLYLSLQTLNLDVQRSFDFYTLALGFELRKDRYQVLSGDKYSYFDYGQPDATWSPGSNVLSGIQGFPGIAPSEEVNEDRDVASVYLELSGELSDSFNFNSAMRYDDYDGFGSTSNIKLAANWRLTDEFNLRSSISTGFRAPSMQQLYFNNISTQFLVNSENELTAEQVGTFRNDSTLAQSVGIPPLKEEQSKNFSLGAVFDINEQLSLTIDYYAINIEDRIVISNKLSPEDSVALAQAMASAKVDKAQVFINGVDTQTRGIDIISTWHHQLFTGQHSVTFAANFTDTQVTKLNSPKNSELQQLTIDQVFAKQDISIIEQWQPKDRVSLSSLYQQDNWSLNIALNRYGKYTILDGESQTYGAKTLTDVRYEHMLSQQLSWYLGVNNLFDVMPDKNAIGNSHAGQIFDTHGNEIVNSPGVFKYSRRSAPFGFNGSYLYTGINYQF